MSLFNVRLVPLQTSRQIMYFCRMSSSRPPAAVTQVLTASDYQTLVTDEHRQRCMEKLQNLPQFPRPSYVPSKHEQTSASVLIALCLERDTNEISLLYTRRSRHLRRHSMQISFPGGKRDANDNSYVDCALRETEEEIGLPRERVQIWGETALMRFPRSAAIMPVVGVVQDFHISQLKLNQDEVEEVVSIPLNSLLTSQAARHTQFRGGYSGPVFIVDQTRIWGITGYLTYMFLRCVLPAKLLPDSLKNSIKFVRPYKVQSKPQHHHVEYNERATQGTSN